jgi:hypothetical protein
VGVNQLHAGEAKIAAAGGGQGVHNVAEGVVVAEELHLHGEKKRYALRFSEKWK